ncbi:uncharacterized protein TM35_000311830 [Trypanosoma theileri]|uniref:Derlin n=1 Tax=Trypanosoma theileri TaxID=67003 RepID=A0A1X0NMT1_9TRYP|nr:uncharacterized protein TM35_000311830 [Trypanosoma theileri]ORC85997.1 hypothetical protein TM35_000311830 [Trypanosoma theileri]
MAQNFETWLKNLPPITQYVLGIAVLLTVISSFEVIDIERLLLTQKVITRMELWRPFTSAFFLGKFSFNWPFSLAILVMYSNYNEKFDYDGKSGDYLWMWLFMITAVTVLGLLIPLYITSSALMMGLCWVFCKRHPEMRMTLFVFEFRANTFPWVLLVFHVIMGGGFVEDIVGIIIGHLYYFVKDILPETQGVQLLQTPAWFLRYVMPNNNNNAAGPRVWTSGGYRPMQTTMGGNTAAASTSASHHQWGKGRTLGSS